MTQPNNDNCAWPTPLGLLTALLLLATAPAIIATKKAFK